ncbi:MAG: hypothetical protein EXS67_05370 [Candidatus Margulisbacteria bacterium]|nr:hypothetical protein [Candidatus Margulisiibacteriota bacterium]
MKPIFFTNGKYQESILNILIENNRIAGMGYLPDENEDDIQIIDIKGSIIIPNLTDAHVQSLPRPEVLAHSGITHIVSKQTGTSPIKHHLISPLTKQSKGQEPSEMLTLKEQGSIAFSDGNSPDNVNLMRNCLDYSNSLDIPIIIRPNETSLTQESAMQEGCISTDLGLAESIRIKRDLQLLATYGGKIHFFPITTAHSVQLIRDAKASHLNVTCGTAPHYLLKTKNDVKDNDTQAKTYPPLRTETDRLALIEGLLDGTIDIIASDHTEAAFGTASFSTLIPSLFTLHQTHDIPMQTLINCVSYNPNRIFKLNHTPFGLGSKASFTIIKLKPEPNITHTIIDGKLERRSF